MTGAKGISKFNSYRSHRTMTTAQKNWLEALKGGTLEEYKNAEKPKRTISHPEYELQKAVVKWFRLQYPKVLMFAIPNGGDLSRYARMRASLAGEVAGVPDTMILCAKGGYHGLFVEFKNGRKGKISDRQKAVHKYCESMGYKVIIGRQTEQAIREISEYMSK